MRQTDISKLPDGMHKAAPNLFLFVEGTKRSWIFRMSKDKKTIKRGLGSASIVTLSMAKLKADQMRQIVREGKKEEEREPVAFRDIYQEAIAARENVARWKNEKHRAQWTSTIERYALRALGDKDVAEITRDDILDVLRPIWETKTETAKRVRGRLETIFSYAIRRGYREKENPARWKDGLSFDLPQPTKVSTVTHHEAPTLDELRDIAPHLMQSIGGRAILFGLLTASRVGEFVPAKWTEIDLRRRVWSVPPERRKDGKPYPHRVPLSTQAMAVLDLCDRDSEFLFPGQAGPHLHQETPRLLLIKMLGRKVTMHGCRSTFRDWCAETGKDAVLAEKSLMHSTGNEVEQAYQRSDLLERRRPLMQAWGDAVLKLT